MTAADHQQKHLRRELDLLSRTGVGLPAVAPALSGLIRQIVGAQTCVIMWVDPDGMPTGVHHEHPNEATQSLFMNEYERLFEGAHETNVSWLVRQRGQACGLLLNPPAAYFRSNTYNLQVRADHYRYMLDLRIDVDGVTRAVVALLRAAGKAFDEVDAITLSSLLPALQRASTNVVSALQGGTDQECPGHLMVSADGTFIHMANEEGIALLRKSRLVGQQIELLGAMQTVPRFVRELCTRLHASERPMVESSVEVPSGALQCSASWMDAAAGATTNRPARFWWRSNCGSHAPRGSYAVSASSACRRCKVASPYMRRLVGNATSAPRPMKSALKRSKNTCGRFSL